MTPRIGVLGLGNVLLADDGLGPFVVELLRAGWEFPEHVELADVGTPGLGLLTYIHGIDVLILIDAVSAAGQPGDVRIYRGSELMTVPAGPRVSPHDPAVHEVLSIAALDGAGPREVLLIGVIPASRELGGSMSTRVRAGAATATRLVVDELGRRGARPVARGAAADPQPWWLQPAKLEDVSHAPRNPSEPPL